MKSLQNGRKKDLTRRDGTGSSMSPASTVQTSARARSLCDFREKKPTITRQSCAGLAFRNVSVVLRRGTCKLLKIIGFRDGANSPTSAADMPRPKQFPRAKIYRPFRANLAPCQRVVRARRGGKIQDLAPSRLPLEIAALRSFSALQGAMTGLIKGHDKGD